MKNKKSKIKLDTFHYHEAIHTTHIFSKILEEHLLKHPVVQKHRKVKKKVNKVLELLADIYQDINAYDAKQDDIDNYRPINQ